MKKIILSLILDLFVLQMCLFPTTTSKIIGSKLSQLGFTAGAQTSLQGGLYSVRINNFRPASEAVALTGAFQPFSLHVKIIKNKIYLGATELRRKRYTINKIHISPGDGIEFCADLSEYIRTFQGEHNEIQTNLRSIRRFRDQSRDRVEEIHQKADMIERIINECAPSPPSDIPAIQAKLSRIGLSVGKITPNKGGRYSIQITGIAPASKIKLKKGIKTPLLIEARLESGDLLVGRLQWQTNFQQSPEFFRYKYDTDGTHDSPPMTPSDFSFPALGGTGLFYRTCAADCTCYISNSNTAREKAAATSAYFEELLETMTRFHSTWRDFCSAQQIDEGEKTVMRRTISNIRNTSDRIFTLFEPIISECENILSRYLECKENEPPPVRR